MSFTDEEIARIAYAAARELQQALGNDAPLPWTSLDSNARGNEIYLVKAARFGATPEAVHEQRMQLVKDLPPFDQLPPGDRAKEYLFAGICAAMNQASDVKARAENDELALREAMEQQARNTGANFGNLPFGGAEPVIIEQQAAQPPRQPAQAPREEG